MTSVTTSVNHGQAGNNNITVDMATALELPLGVENEAKFVALRNLQLKKVKQLMASLDAKDREIAKLKILGKDNRRTQMIQALKNKIRDLELINDFIKEEYSRKEEMTMEEVNKIIMRKTLSGPKRFRPLTREELENKIYELEKKANKKAVSSENNYTQEQEQKMKGESDGQSKTSRQRNTDDLKTNFAEPLPTTTTDQLDAFALFDEVQSLKANLNAKDNTMNNLKDEIVRLRSRNAELVAAEEEIDFFERQCEELKESNDILSKNLEDTASKLASALEALSKVKADQALHQETDKSEVVTLRNQCEKLLKQNTSLLKNLADAEETISRYEDETVKKTEKVTSVENTVQNKDGKIKMLEDKLVKADDKIRQLEARCTALETENAQIDALKNQLREKNIEIKEIKRNLQEREKAMNLKLSASKTSLRSESPELHIVAEEKEKEHFSHSEK